MQCAASQNQSLTMRQTTCTNHVLGIVAETCAYRHERRMHIHTSFGRVIDRLAGRYEKVCLCVPVADKPPTAAGDYRLNADNIEVIAQPFYSGSMGALRHPFGIVQAYWRACHCSDAIFFRGMLPHIGALYAICRILGKRPCHWIVGDPIALLKSHRRSGSLMTAASLAYARWDRFCTRLGRRLTGGSLICNGKELGEVYRSPRTYVTVSSTVTDDEFFERVDTCQGDVIRILFVGFIRPEKGVEYLLQAVSRLRTDRTWELVLVGSSDGYDGYRRRLEDLASRLSIGGRVRWEGYAPYGPELFRHLREADVFVLPTLSEGTPRVLVEARANSVPVVATNVGGIPTSVTDGMDGLLVPPKDPEALAAAIDRVIEDDELRQSLIRNGLDSARRYTVDQFAELVLGVMGDG